MKVKLDNLEFNIREGTMDEYVLKEQKGYLSKIKLTKDDVWLDIGGHIGIFSLLISNRVNKCISFEPDNDNYLMFVKNRKLNNVENVSVYQYAIIGNFDKTRTFYINKKKNTGGHSFLIKRGREVVECKCANINKVINKFNTNKIKMDVEGAEYEIIEAISDSALEKIDEMIFEYHFNILRDHPDHLKYKETIQKLETYFKEVDCKRDIKKHWHTIVYCHK